MKLINNAKYNMITFQPTQTFIQDIQISRMLEIYVMNTWIIQSLAGEIYFMKLLINWLNMMAKKLLKRKRQKIIKMTKIKIKKMLKKKKF